MVGQCWSSVEDDGPTLAQHWVDVSRLLGGNYVGLGSRWCGPAGQPIADPDSHRFQYCRCMPRGRTGGTV